MHADLSVVCCSSPTLHDQRELAALGEARIVVELRNLELAERQQAVLNLVIRRFEQPLQFYHSHALDARYSLRHGDQLAEIDSGAESQIIRMEDPAPPVRQRAIAEQVEQRRFDLSAQVMWQDADSHLDLERDVLRLPHSQVMAYPPVLIEISLDL